MTGARRARPRKRRPPPDPATFAPRPSLRSASRPAGRTPARAPKSAAAAARPLRSAAPAPRPGDTPPPSARCRKTRPRTGPGRGAGQRQRGEPQPGRPALGPGLQQRPARDPELSPRRSEQRPRFIGGEPQIGGADLGQFALKTKAVQSEPQVISRGEDKRSSRPAHDQQLQLAQRLSGVQLVRVVDHQPQRLVQRTEVRQQPLDDRPAVQVGAAVSSLTSSDPAVVSRSASSTEIQTAVDPAPHPAPAPMRPGRPGRRKPARIAANRSSRSRPAPRYR